MKLIISTVSSEDANALIDELTQYNYNITVAGTTESTLTGKHTTIFVNVEKNQVKKVLKIIKEVCHSRIQFSNPLPPIIGPGEMSFSSAVETKIGGATVFVVDVEQFHQF